MDTEAHALSPRAYLRSAIVLLRSEIVEIRSRAACRSGDVHRLAQAERELALVEEELAGLERINQARLA